MKTSLHVKIALLTIVLVAAMQAISSPRHFPPPPPEQPWKSGETTVTLSEDGILTVSGNGAMEDYAFGQGNYTPWERAILYVAAPQITAVVIVEGVTSIGKDAFVGCRSLTSVTIPSSVKTIGAGAFDGCDSLTSVIIEDGVESIGSSAFYYCKNLAAVTIPQSVTSIEAGAFMECHSLTSITIPGSVTSIGNLAFAGSGLSSVTIGNGVAYIGDNAFFRCCGKQASITIQNSQPPKIGSDPFRNVYLYVPARSYFAYRAADGWNEYGLRVFFNIYEILALCILSVLLLSAAVFVIIKKLRKARQCS